MPSQPGGLDSRGFKGPRKRQLKDTPTLGTQPARSSRALGLDVARPLPGWRRANTDQCLGHWAVDVGPRPVPGNRGVATPAAPAPPAGLLFATL